MRIAVLVLAASLVCAQEPRPPDAETAYRGLLDELRGAQQDAVKSYLADVEKRKAEAAKEGRAPALPGFDMGGTAAAFLPRFEAGAREFAGSDGAVPFLLWIVSNAPAPDTRGGALDTLLRDHVASGKLASLPRGIGYALPHRAAAVYDALIEKSPHADVKAEALLARGAGAIGDDTPEDSPAAKSGLADLERAVETAESPALLARAEGALREKLTLRIGKQAPEIEGKDLDGVAFKLSEYRGKVVVLDFWGDW